VFVVRMLENGSVDPGFGTAGVVLPDRYHQLPRLALQSDGRSCSRLAARPTAGRIAFIVERSCAAR
jgi:hypothetical protein